MVYNIATALKTTRLYHHICRNLNINESELSTGEFESTLHVQKSVTCHGLNNSSRINSASNNMLAI